MAQIRGAAAGPSAHRTALPGRQAPCWSHKYAVVASCARSRAPHDLPGLCNWRRTGLSLPVSTALILPVFYSRALYLLALRLSLSLWLSLLLLYHGSPRRMLCRPHAPTACSLCRCWFWNPDRVQAPPAIVHLCICTANIVVPASFCSDDPFLDVDSRGSCDGWGCFCDCCALTYRELHTGAKQQRPEYTPQQACTRLMLLCIKVWSVIVISEHCQIRRASVYVLQCVCASAWGAVRIVRCIC